jgi:hypothetical protein
VEFSGTISGLIGACPNVLLTIGGTAVVADASTDFHKSKCSDLRNGRSASGEGVVQLLGVVKATRIEADKK